MKIDVNYHSSMAINDEIFVDPLNIVGKKEAKYIFLTHPHWDHFSVEDIEKIVAADTIFVCPVTMKKEVEKHFKNKILAVEPNKSYHLDGIDFDVFASYNTNKKFHPKQNGWVGFNMTIENTKIAITGDTDVTEELLNLKTDILLLPIGGTYTMTFDEAARVTNIIKPKKVIPIHYGKVVGDKSLGEKFKQLVNDKIVCELKL